MDFLTLASASQAEMCAARTRRRLLEQRFDSVCADCGLVANNVQLCRGGEEVIVSLSSCQEPTVHFYVGLRCARRAKSGVSSKSQDINTNLLAAISAGENVTMLRTNRPTPLKRGSLQKKQMKEKKQIICKAPNALF